MLAVIIIRNICKGRENRIQKYLIYTSTFSPEVYIIPPRGVLKSEAKFFKTSGREGSYPLHKGPYQNIEDAFQAIKKYEKEVNK